MSSTTPIETDQAPAAIGPYSQGRAGAGLVFVSGQLGLDPATGELKGTQLAAQTRQALANMVAVLQAGGCTLEDVASVDVFLTNMGGFQEFNRIYEEFFGTHKPTRAVVAVKALPKGARVEIKCLAVKNE